MCHPVDDVHATYLGFLFLFRLNACLERLLNIGGYGITVVLFRRFFTPGSWKGLQESKGWFVNIGTGHNWVCYDVRCYGLNTKLLNTIRGLCEFRVVLSYFREPLLDEVRFH